MNLQIPAVAMGNTSKTHVSIKPTTIFSCGRWRVVNLENLIFVESQGRYKYFYFSDRKEPYKVDSTMDSVKKGLAAYEGFVAVHRSFVLNMKYVISYDAKCAYVFHNGKEHSIPVTHNNMKKQFVELFGE